VDPLRIVIALELEEVLLEVTTIPRSYIVEKLSPRSADEAGVERSVAA